MAERHWPGKANRAAFIQVLLQTLSRRNWWCAEPMDGRKDAVEQIPTDRKLDQSECDDATPINGLNEPHIIGMLIEIAFHLGNVDLIMFIVSSRRVSNPQWPHPPKVPA